MTRGPGPRRLSQPDRHVPDSAYSIPGAVPALGDPVLGLLQRPAPPHCWRSEVVVRCKVQIDGQFPGTRSQLQPSMAELVSQELELRDQGEVVEPLEGDEVEPVAPLEQRDVGALAQPRLEGHALESVEVVPHDRPRHFRARSKAARKTLNHAGELVVQEHSRRGTRCLPEEQRTLDVQRLLALQGPYMGNDPGTKDSIEQDLSGLGVGPHHLPPHGATVAREHGTRAAGVEDHVLNSSPPPAAGSPTRAPP